MFGRPMLVGSIGMGRLAIRPTEGWAVAPMPARGLCLRLNFTVAALPSGSEKRN